MLSIVLLLCHGVALDNVFAQSDFISSQYMNSQLTINPAYAGVRNAFSVQALSRQQWMGLKDAPTTYAVNVHSPLNKRMASLGASVLSYQNGPIQQNEFTAMYSYLLRLNHHLFVSMGVSAQINHYNVGLNALEVIEDNDPSFSQDFENGFKPNFGAGVFLFSPRFFVGFSMPQILSNKLSIEETGSVVLEQFRSAYFTFGYAFDLGKNVSLKPSFLARLRQNTSNAIDVNLQLMYKNMFWVGASYRFNQTFASLLNVQVSKTMAICYSYDFSIAKELRFGGGSHEVSLMIDSNSFIKRNRDRRFNRKKVTKSDEEKGVQSIRYF
ncbi:type IX secretion system membrane protein PorP/SprF [Carboxylicivirga sp. M1479]|uniref:PorP/SprF family type IX secretion system membrane protein n=1 Tax=Carboxylicivirga sp. M1479 TaxID=2594476 RepID=UPI00163D87D1|nr:type IX secretion system membrane protein PorP/SprF [Carboxylicivirga sp. M1479]